MDDRSRRRLLRTGGLGAGLLLTGCLGDNAQAPSVTDIDTVQYALGSEARGWDQSEQVGVAALIDSTDRYEALDRSPPTDRATDVNAMLDETDFDQDRLLFIESAGPNTCYDEVQVGNASISPGSDTLHTTATATATGQSGCGGAITYPSSLTRTRFGGSPVNRARVTVTDGWGDQGAIEVTTTDPLPNGDG